MKLIELIREDMAANSHAKSKFVLVFYRTAHASGQLPSRFLRALTAPWRAAYRIITDWIMGIDIPSGTQIGRRVVLYHSTGLVINAGSIIGDDCVLRHGVTIGNKLTPDGETGCPRLGDRVEIGAGAALLGELIIGDRARIGAGAIVVKDVPAGATVVGNPARILTSESSQEEAAE